MPVPVATGGYNADGMASMEAYNGEIYCGSSINGKVYKVIGTTTSTTEIPDLFSVHYQLTEHSIIFHIKNSVSVNLNVYNLLGSEVKNVFWGTLGTGRQEINLDFLEKGGVYLLEAKVGQEVKGIKFVRR